MFTSYQEVIDFLFAQLPMYQRMGKAAYKANLNNTIALCNLMGNPEKEIPAIHVAGTNGKGSVSCMIASALMEQGYRVGLYTSPHLTDFRERITINGRKIEEEAVVDFVNQYRTQFLPIRPSFFELTFAMALDFFKKRAVQIAVFETGMGGRLDSTNLVQPILSVITNIGHDHQQFLGDTLTKVAREKAGIIKEGIPVIIGEKHPESMKVFMEKAEEQHAAILFAEEHLTISPAKRLPPDSTTQKNTIRYSLTSEENTLPLSIQTELMGSYQIQNIRTAIVALSMLRNTFFPVNGKNIREGFMHLIKNTHLRGRWQIIETTPLIVCDTGHNKEGIHEVVKMISQQPYKHLHLVLGAVNDKDPMDLLGAFPSEATFYFCKPNIPRGQEVERLYEEGKALGIQKMQCHKTVSEAYQNAVSQVGEGDMLFVGGSTFVVADLLQFLHK
ncbi:MAG: tetrahydrofolate synthase [Bacteroidetes bacterium]|nr:MAG: tetrahydrofolate synthase [Bacteroidota bacterium]PIE88279.1 MAG: tetrahydrofolate synthase [Bacteroidota bacterium]